MVSKVAPQKMQFLGATKKVASHTAKNLTLIRFITFCTETHFPEMLTKSTVRIGDASLVQNSTKHPQSASEVNGENSCEILSLKV